MPGFGGTQNLARLIGPNRANELIFTGRMIAARKACAWGIVNEVFPPEELLPKALETAGNHRRRWEPSASPTPRMPLPTAST